jgi:hypothetical protein
VAITYEAGAGGETSETVSQKIFNELPGRENEGRIQIEIRRNGKPE